MLLLVLIIAALALGFTPISRALLRSVHGSFTPSGYSSLALKNPPAVDVGIPAGKSIAVELMNGTDHTKTYHWSAKQGGTLISLGEETVRSDQATKILVPSRGATAGSMRIAISGTNIFLTVPILGS
jgi:hypothetical protein